MTTWTKLQPKLQPLYPLPEKMSIQSVMCFTLLIIVMLMTKCTARSKLSMWIDEGQVKGMVGMPMQLNIIEEGEVFNLLSQDDLEESLPVLDPDVDTVNLTWEAGDEFFTYWFDNLKSKNKTILYNPLLSIPAFGIIPKGPKIFQVSIPCTGKYDGIAHLVLGLQIMDENDRLIDGTPLKLKIKKHCMQFETTKLCKLPCQNNGRCNQFGECECTQGFHGKYCEVDMCNPKCQNNGTCISPGMCLCLEGFSGKRCETALCPKPCQNGGRCVQSDGVCWCTKGFHGGACEYSYCKEGCEHDGLCVGTNMCNCKDGYSGIRCEKGIDRTRRRVNKQRHDIIKAEKHKKKCERKKQSEIKKRCNKTKKCQSKQERIAKRCKSQREKRQKRCKKRQAKLASRCVKLNDKRRKRCVKKQEEKAIQCLSKQRKKKKGKS